MKYKISDDRKTLTVTVDAGERKLLRKLTKETGIQSDEAMLDWFAVLISNADLEWINPSETGDLTSAPMLGIRNDQQPPEVIERWAFMDYQVRSVLEDLRDKGNAVFVS